MQFTSKSKGAQMSDPDRMIILGMQVTCDMKICHDLVLRSIFKVKITKTLKTAVSLH